MRALNMQALTDDIKAEYPGVVVYGIGDKAHQSEPSGHNEDDTPGSKPELTDKDNKAEHRAIDVMIGPSFIHIMATGLVRRLLADPRATRRMYYIIWDGWIWSRSDRWKRRLYSGRDKHTNHIHISGWMDDDDNASSWPAVDRLPQPSKPATPAKDEDMEQTDKLIKDTGSPNRTVGDVFADAQNLRNYLVTDVSKTGKVKPENNSPLDLLVDMAMAVQTMQRDVAEIKARLSSEE